MASEAMVCKISVKYHQYKCLVKYIYIDDILQGSCSDEVFNVRITNIFSYNIINQYTFEYPMILGNVREEHPSGLCPRLINGVWKVALSEAYTRSHSPRAVTAMPTAGPFTAAINGLENSMYASTYLLRKIIHTVYNMTRNLTKSVLTLISRNRQAHEISKSISL